MAAVSIAISGHLVYDQQILIEIGYQQLSHLHNYSTLNDELGQN